MRGLLNKLTIKTRDSKTIPVDLRNEPSLTSSPQPTSETNEWIQQATWHETSTSFRQSTNETSERIQQATWYATSTCYGQTSSSRSTSEISNRPKPRRLNIDPNKSTLTFLNSDFDFVLRHDLHSCCSPSTPRTLLSERLDGCTLLNLTPEALFAV